MSEIKIYSPDDVGFSEEREEEKKSQKSSIGMAGIIVTQTV